MAGREIKQQILELTKQYYQEQFKNEESFLAGDRIGYAGRVFDEAELVNLVDASLEFWLTAGRYALQFEREFAKFLGVSHCSLTNSGSSANLLAFMALTSPKLGKRQIQKGDEVITVAAGFPTTVAPILQYGAIPVFVDVSIPEYNIDVSQLEAACTDKTKAVMVAHTLGNPFDLSAVKAFCDAHQLWLVEDNCDALGSLVKWNGEWKYTGTIGDIGTSSFYPPHHMTMGEGGAVYTDHAELYRIVNSLRDWGRDCYCQPGVDNTCRHRFERQYGELPQGYDHKYVYSHFGYNLKVTDMQAAVGCAQLNKLPDFIRRRRENWQYLRDGLRDCEEQLILPEAQKDTKPSWFGFLMTVKEGVGFTRDELSGFLEEHHIQTRNLFAGNLIKHPCFDQIRETGDAYRVVGSLDNTDFIMNNSLWIGVYPGMTKEKLDFMMEQIKGFVKR